MMSAFQRTPRLRSEVTHPRLHGESVAGLRLGPGALLNPKLFVACLAVPALRKCPSIQLKHGEETGPMLRTRALPITSYKELASPGPGYLCD